MYVSLAFFLMSSSFSRIKPSTLPFTSWKLFAGHLVKSLLNGPDLGPLLNASTQSAGGVLFKLNADVCKPGDVLPQCLVFVLANASEGFQCYFLAFTGREV